MRDRELTSLLREVPIPGAEDAERRGLAMVQEAFDQRRPARRSPLPRLAVALAAATLLAALFLTPAGAAVRDWIDDVLTVGVKDARPGLTAVPGGGRLLVEGPAGPWVVAPDGSRRLLGHYREATWSPHGLFVAAASGRTLTALEPNGTPHWSLSAGGPVADPRWSPSGLRIAFRAGRALHVVSGDGSGERRLDPKVAPVPAVWWPQGPHLLAYVDAREIRVLNADTGEAVGSAPAPAGAAILDWAPDGSRILVASPRALLTRSVQTHKLTATVAFGAPSAAPLPAGARIRSARFSPDGGTIAVLLGLPAQDGRPPHSEVVLMDVAGGPPRRLFTAPGRLADLVWSPDGRRLLIPWPDADQWLFIPAKRGGRPRAIGQISAVFNPGAKPGTAGFARIEGWCCAATAGGG